MVQRSPQEARNSTGRSRGVATTEGRAWGTSSTGNYRASTKPGPRPVTGNMPVTGQIPVTGFQWKPGSALIYRGILGGTLRR